MESEKDAFYVVKKGDIIGVYRSLNDCQALLETSGSNLPVSVHKGYGLTKDAEDYLRSHGVQNACYTIGAADVADNLFGQLAICPFQQPEEISPKKDYARKGFQYCILEFDGASKGNPGPAGAGVVLRAESVGMVFRLSEGVGTATCNVAEYRALILGLKYALMKGFTHIRAQGDSNLVCMQVQGLWKTKNQNMADLCKVAKELKDQFLSFEIRHVERLLKVASEEGLISSSQMVKGFARLSESLDDLALDIPSARSLFDSLVPLAISEGWLDESILGISGEDQAIIQNGDEEKVRKYKEKIVSIIHEYFLSDDIPELIQSLEDLEAPEYNPIFLKKLITLAMDRKNGEKALNSEADALANQGVHLQNGQVQVDSELMEKC